MQELEKILEEIGSEFDRRINIQLKIMTGLGDDVYRYGYGKSLESYQQGKLLVTEIISKHMNDGWIPVEERNPEVGQYVLGTNKYGEVMIYRYGWNSPHTRKMFFHLCGSAVTIIAWRPIPEPYSTTKGDTNGKE